MYFIISLSGLISPETHYYTTPAGTVCTEDGKYSEVRKEHECVLMWQSMNGHMETFIVSALIALDQVDLCIYVQLYAHSFIKTWGVRENGYIDPNYSNTALCIVHFRRYNGTITFNRRIGHDRRISLVKILFHHYTRFEHHCKITSCWRLKFPVIPVAPLHLPHTPRFPEFSGGVFSDSQNAVVFCILVSLKFRDTLPLHLLELHNRFSRGIYSPQFVQQ